MEKENYSHDSEKLVRLIFQNGASGSHEIGRRIIESWGLLYFLNFLNERKIRLHVIQVFVICKSSLWI